MSADTIVYFRCEWVTLGLLFGSDAIIDPELNTGVDSAEVTTRTLTERRISRVLGYPKNKTRGWFRIGVSTSGSISQNWVQTTQATYDALVAASALTANEISTYTATAPTPFALTGTYAQFMPKIGVKNVFVIGDSISFGTSPTAGLPNSPISKAIQILDATAIADITEPADRGWIGKAWASCNLALGSSSWANTVGSGATEDRATYPRPFNLAKNQRFLTLALNGQESCIIHPWLGTNDIAYDSSQTAASVWARTTTYVGELASEFPNAKIVLGTLIRRTEDATLNGKVAAYNALLKANYLSIGAHYYVDYEAAHPDFSTGAGGDSTITSDCFWPDPLNGDSGTTGDGVHPNNFGSLQLGTALATTLAGVTF